MGKSPATGKREFGEKKLGGSKRGSFGPLILYCISNIYVANVANYLHINVANVGIFLRPRNPIVH